MDAPFKFGIWLGNDMADKGWLIMGKSEAQLAQDAALLAKHGLPEENDEDRTTVAAGILHAWKTKIDKHP